MALEELGAPFHFSYKPRRRPNGRRKGSGETDAVCASNKEGKIAIDERRCSSRQHSSASLEKKTQVSLTPDRRCIIILTYLW